MLLSKCWFSSTSLEIDRAAEFEPKLLFLIEKSKLRTELYGRAF